MKTRDLKENIWKKYTYQVRWSAEDQEYVGLCVEMQGLSYLSETFYGAMNGIIRVTKEAVEWLCEDGIDLPPPIDWDKTILVPKETK